MALKYGTENVTDVTYKVGTTNNVVTIIKNTNGTVYWARPGSISLDTKTGISRTDASREATLEPTASTGTLSGAATIYHGDTLTIYGTPEPYWTVASPVSATVDFLTTKVFSASSVLNPTRKLRSIIISNPDGNAIVQVTYTDASGESQTYTMPTNTAPSPTIKNTWCGGAAQYSSVILVPPSSIWFKNATSGTIAAQDSEAAVTIDMQYKTFNLRTYSHGTITYYTSSSMTTTITQSKYSTSLYYKYTPSGGYYVKDGSSYTRYITGAVPTADANVSGNTWGAFVTEPELYGKVQVTLKHRGQASYNIPPSKTWLELGANTPSVATHILYVPVPSEFRIYALYVDKATSTTGLTTSTYGSSNDTYTSSSSYRSVTVQNPLTTILLEGALKTRTVTINQVKAAHNTGTSLQYYSTLTGEPVTYSNVHLDKLMPTDVWAGATVTRSATGTFVPATGWTTSGYVGTTAVGTAAMSATVYATYTYTSTIAAPALRYASDHKSVTVYNPNTTSVSYATGASIKFTDSDDNISSFSPSGSMTARATATFVSTNSFEEISIQANMALSSGAVTSPTSTLDWS